MEYFRKVLLKFLAAVALGILLCLMVESLLQPKLRIVDLEGVPFSVEPLDVTFMSGAVMDPLVKTNPFLQLFSPLDNLTSGLRVPKGEIQELSDTSVIFVWECFGRRSVWYIDRVSKEITPLVIARGESSVDICSRTFPALAWYCRKHEDLKIRRSARMFGVDLFDGSGWVWMKVDPENYALRPD